MNNMEINDLKKQYSEGEIVEGTLTISIDKGVKPREIRLSAYGEENVVLSVDDPTTNYSESNVFYSEDFSDFVKLIWNTGTSFDEAEHRIPQVTRNVPFQFTIPEWAPESYSGKHVWITYRIKANMDLPNKYDVNKEAYFDVLNLHKTPKSNDSTVVVETSSTTTIFESQQTAEKEGGMRLELEKNSDEYYRGETIKGKVIVEKDTELRKYLRNMEITLKSLEYATAQGKHKTSTIQKYPKIIDWKMEKGKEGENIIIPFDIQIPQEAKRSYLWTLSEYYWVLEAKINVKLGSDLHARAMVTVIRNLKLLVSDGL
jgi:hypothetical protein